MAMQEPIVMLAKLLDVVHGGSQRRDPEYDSFDEKSEPVTGSTRLRGCCP
jgi:hypothetical protein